MSEVLLPHMLLAYIGVTLVIVGPAVLLRLALRSHRRHRGDHGEGLGLLWEQTQPLPRLRHRRHARRPYHERVRRPVLPVRHPRAVRTAEPGLWRSTHSIGGDRR